MEEQERLLWIRREEEKLSGRKFSEYSYVISSGDRWYEIEIGGFGNVEEMSSGTGQYIDD